MKKNTATAIVFVLALAIAAFFVLWYVQEDQSPSSTSKSSTKRGPVAYQPHPYPMPRGVGITSTELAAPARFVDVTDTAHISYRWTLAGQSPRNILQMIGNGCAFLDYDNSGNLSILLVGPKLALYKGDGNGHFIDATHQTGLDKFRGDFLGCAVGDYDNDGYDDIFITGYDTALLLHNEKGKYFRDVTRESGIKTNSWSTSAAFGDIDNDGKLDLYVCNYCEFGPNSTQLCPGNDPAARVMEACSPAVYHPQFGTLYKGDGHGHFVDVTKKWIPSDVHGKNLGVAFADIDGSGRQSLFIANDRVKSDLLLNKGDHFVNIGQESGVDDDYSVGSTSYAGMGVDWADYDNGGKLDLAVMDYQFESKCVFQNEGSGLFTNQSRKLGLELSGYPWVAWGVKWFDYDNDGWLDLIYSNGNAIDEAIEKEYSNDPFREPTKLYHNDHGEKLDDVSIGLVGNADRPIVGRGLAIGDFDNDGRVDVLVVDSSGKPILLRNETPDVGHWLEVNLVGTKSNRDGYGAVVTAEIGERKLLRVCHSDGSYMSSSDKRVHIGLGNAKRIDILSVKWPSGQTDQFQDVPVDRIITITEGQNRIAP